MPRSFASYTETSVNAFEFNPKSQELVERKQDWTDFYQNTILPIMDLVAQDRYDDALKIYKYATACLVNEYIRYADRELVTKIFDSAFNNSGLPYAVKYACIKAYLAVKLPVTKWKINYGILRK